MKGIAGGSTIMGYALCEKGMILNGLKLYEEALRVREKTGMSETSLSH